MEKVLKVQSGKLPILPHITTLITSSVLLTSTDLDNLNQHVLNMMLRPINKGIKQNHLQLKIYFLDSALLDSNLLLLMVIILRRLSMHSIRPEPSLRSQPVLLQRPSRENISQILRIRKTGTENQSLVRP
jgi:hypothetical protein